MRDVLALTALLAATSCLFLIQMRAEATHLRDSIAVNRLSHHHGLPGNPGPRLVIEGEV